MNAKLINLKRRAISDYVKWGFVITVKWKKESMYMIRNPFYEIIIIKQKLHAYIGVADMHRDM